MAVPVAAEAVFSLGPIPVTNAMVNGWIAAAVFLAVGFAIRKRTVAGVPGKLQNVAEAALEFMLSFMDQVTHDRKRSERFFPIVGTLFLFILVSNWMGLLPGVGTLGVWGSHEGRPTLIPLFRPATSDLNMTLAMGITAVVVSHVLGVMTIGFFKYWNKFIQVGTIWTAIKGFRKKGLADAVIELFTAVIEFFVGLLELVSEAAKMVSLSLRLFGNIFAGEVLLHVLSSLIAFVMPVPFMFMEIIVGAVQALVFSMLALVYLTIATEAPHGSEQKHEEDVLGEAHGSGDVHAARTAGEAH